MTLPDEFIRQEVGADSQRFQNIPADLEEQLGVLGVILGGWIPTIICPEFQQNWGEAGGEIIPDQTFIPSEFPDFPLPAGILPWRRK